MCVCVCDFFEFKFRTKIEKHCIELLTGNNLHLFTLSLSKENTSNILILSFFELFISYCLIMKISINITISGIAIFIIYQCIECFGLFF